MLGLKLQKETEFIESIRYIANRLIRLAQGGNGNVIGISSSRYYGEERKAICEFLNKEITKKNVNSKLIDVENGNIKTPQKLEHLLTEEKEKNDIIIVNIPPIPYIADSVEYAKRCDMTLLLEKYMYSTYKDYEEAIIRLKSYGIKLEGVLTYGE